MNDYSSWFDALHLEITLSQEAKRCFARINNCGVWWQPSRNYKDTMVYSCKQAVKYRVRLGSGGNGGIPLWSELKSLFGIAIDTRYNISIYFAAHTRANTAFDEPSILTSLGLDVIHSKIIKFLDPDNSPNDDNAVISETDNKEELSISKFYGTVNPFNIDLLFNDIPGVKIGIDNIHQLFDESLYLHGGFPNTIMSNLGDRRIAFELHPEDLIDIVKILSPLSIVVNIAHPCPIWLGYEGNFQKNYWLQFPPPNGPKIGILTGNSPESGLTLWKDILASIRKQFTNLADVFMPELQIYSLPQMGLSMELVLREEHVWNEMRSAIIMLLEMGCKIITLACNTTIYFEPKITSLCKEYNATFVSIAEACMPAIKRALISTNDTKSVGLVGIGPVVDMEGTYSGYKKYLTAEGIHVTPCSGEKLAFDLKYTGKQDKLITEFRRLINTEIPNETVIVLALTEVSIVYREHIEKASKKYISNKVFIDPLFELAQYITFMYLNIGYRRCPVCQIPVNFNIDNILNDHIFHTFNNIEVSQKA